MINSHVQGRSYATLTITLGTGLDASSPPSSPLSSNIKRSFRIDPDQLGSRVAAEEGIRVAAEEGSRVAAEEGSRVALEEGSRVAAEEGSPKSV
jgi:hypothetical protein